MKNLNLLAIFLFISPGCANLKSKFEKKEPFVEIAVGNCFGGFGVSRPNGEQEFVDFLDTEETYVCMKADDFKEFEKRLNKKWR